MPIRSQKAVSVKKNPVAKKNGWVVECLAPTPDTWGYLDTDTSARRVIISGIGS
jgi:hypothetical protein